MRSKNESGASTLEYVLLLSFIVLAILASTKILGFSVHDSLEHSRAELGGGTEATDYYIRACPPDATNCNSAGMESQFYGSGSRDTTNQR